MEARMKRISLLLLFFACFAFASDFEQSLIEQSSDMEQVYRLREAMLSAVNEKDSAKVIALTEMLEEKQSDNLLTIRLEELEVLYLHAKMYNALTEYLVKRYRNLPRKQPTGLDEPSPDGLSIFVKKRVEHRDTSKHFFQIFATQVKYSNISDAEKRKLELFVYLNDAYKSRENAKHVAWLARSYANDYPDDPDSPWIKENIADPLKRMDFYKYTYEKRAENKEDFIRYKLYTGGFGFNLYLFTGGIVHSFEDYYSKNNVEPFDFEFHAELYLQFGRFVPMFDIVDLGVPGFTTLAFGLGFVAFDSRYLKVRPYVEYGMTGMYAEVTQKYPQVNGRPTNGPDSWYETDYEFSDFDGMSVIAGVNVDFKFVTAYFFLSNEKLTSFSLVGKFGVTYADINNELAWGEGVSLFYGLGLGVYFW